MMDQSSTADAAPANPVVFRPWQAVRENAGLGLLMIVHLLVCSASLILVARIQFHASYNAATFHIFFDPARAPLAIAVIVAFALIAPLFSIARFSFGYFAAFYAYTMIAGYLWLNIFSDLPYDHVLAGFSAAASAIAFLLPALFVTAPVRPRFTLSTKAFDRLLWIMLGISAIAVALGMRLNFHIVSFEDMPEAREAILRPSWLNYWLGIVGSSLLPFLFAGFVTRRRYWGAAITLILLLLLFPVTATKMALFTPLWLIAILWLSRLVEARKAVILTLLVPILAGMLLLLIIGQPAGMPFSVINFRMIAIPSLAMDVYNHYFASHPLTHFCHLSVLKHLVPCPYADDLSTVMERAYGLGYFNASLFATAGVAAVGPWFAPLSALVSGLIVAIGNRTSAHLPARFVLVSGAILPQILLNVPLTTAMVTHGMALLFALWYVTPRSIFESDDQESRSARRSLLTALMPAITTPPAEQSA